MCGGTAARDASRCVERSLARRSIPSGCSQEHPGSLGDGAALSGSSLRPLRLCGEQFRFQPLVTGTNRLYLLSGYTDIWLPGSMFSTSSRFSPTRRGAGSLLLLERHELTVGELCTILQLPQSTVSRHLKLLSDDGWLVARGEGTSRFYRMVGDRLDESTRSLWSVVRAQISASPGARRTCAAPRACSPSVATRRNPFFRDSSNLWDVMRTEMIGERADLLALLDLLDDELGRRRPRLRLGPHRRGAGAVREEGHRRRRVGSDARGARASVSHRTTTSSSASAPSSRCRSTMARSTRRFSFSSRTSSPTRRERWPRCAACSRPGGRLLDRRSDVARPGRLRRPARARLAGIRRTTGDRRGWTAAGFAACRYRPLPAEPEAKGPTLFVASGRKQ